MAAPTIDAVAMTGGRFGSALDADDPATVKAAVCSGAYQACKAQLYEAAQRLRPLIASGSDVVLRLRGLADDPDLMPRWRDSLNDSIHRAGLVLAAMRRYPPERGRMQGQLLLPVLHSVGECGSY